MKTISVVLPTFNERTNLSSFVDEVLAQQAKMLGVKIEIVISDGGSSDGTIELAKELAQRDKRVHFLQVEPGLGVGLIKGHLYALKKLYPDIMAQMDSDGQVDASVLPRLVEQIEAGYNLVIGSRFIAGGKNQLSFARKLFSAGSSWVCRHVMGPGDIMEFTNSTRAFTPELFRKINLNHLPWRERTFIIQPAFLHEAVIAGAKYKEVPLVFKNRATGYSKNKVINYIYDILTYTMECKLLSLGLNIPFFRLSHRAKLLIKFGLVGVSGTLLDFLLFKTIIWSVHFTPPIARLFSGELAIINNFTFNNLWTFRHRKTNNNFLAKLVMYNIIAYGGVAIASALMLVLHKSFGDGYVTIGSLRLAYNNFYFFVTIPPVMVWNFTVNHFVTWKKTAS